jgi:hypothetical protein
MFTIMCESELNTALEFANACETGWVQTVAFLPFHISQIEPIVATELFGAGFTLFAIPWAAGFSVVQIFKLLK